MSEDVDIVNGAVYEIVENECKSKRRGQLHIRTTKEEDEMIDMMMYQFDESKSDIVRKAIKMYFNYRKNEL